MPCCSSVFSLFLGLHCYYCPPPRPEPECPTWNEQELEAIVARYAPDTIDKELWGDKGVCLNPPNDYGDKECRILAHDAPILYHECSARLAAVKRFGSASLHGSVSVVLVFGFAFVMVVLHWFRACRQ